MSSLSLCMIVRNEEARFPAALESVRDLADEWIVVDTGSTDRTVEIARALGAQVFPFPWGEDFSAARNFALAQATRDWILSLDADEELDEEDHPQVREFLLRTDLEGVLVAIHETARGPDGKSQLVVHPYPRLFRRRPEIRYQGIVQEFLTGLHATAESTIRIYHDAVDEAVQQQRRARNETLCRNQLARNPRNPLAHFSLAGVCLGEQRFAEARQHFETALQLFDPQAARDQDGALLALQYLSGLCGMQGDVVRALEYCQEALRRQPDYLAPHFLRAELQFRQGKLAEAEQGFERFLELRDRLARQPVRSLLSQARLRSHDQAHLRLGLLCQARGDHPRAEQHYLQALEANPRSAEAHLRLARFYADKQDVGRAQQFLAAARRLQDAATAGN